MHNGWVFLGAVLGVALSTPAWTQQAPDSQAQLAQQQKSNQYLRIEYERCRADLVELWVKGDTAEQRAKDLEQEVRKLENELASLKGGANAKPAN